MSDYYYNVAVNAPLKKTFTYHCDQDLSIGDMVKAPFGRRQIDGLVLASIEKPNVDYELKSVVLNDSFDKIDKKSLELFKWMAEYYHYPLGKLIFDCLPKSMKRPRPTDAILGEKVAGNFELTNEQAVIVEDLLTKSQSTMMGYIHGVTGSGKSVVYLELMKEHIKKNKSVLFLVPEINLTPQFLTFFKERLSCKIYSYHSGITNSQKYNLWKLSSELSEPVLIIGVRSSVFLPVKNLGLIIVDEEHDQSFKQDDRCCYNLRNVVSKKHKLYNSQLIYGSATPSMELYNYFKETDNYYTLKERPHDVVMPEVELINLRKESMDDVQKDFHKFHWPLDLTSFNAITEAISNKEQVIILINKLGYSDFIQCKTCGHQFGCPNCHITLKYFKYKNHISCHSCDYTEKRPEQCPDCGNLNLLPKGFGTEKVSEVLTGLFPEANIARFDRDEIANFKQLKTRLDEFHRGEVDILIGTQMLAKGHNFKNVNTVIVMGIDQQFNYPDFRAYEKVNQLLIQVSGRSGRYEKKGRVFIQTLNIDHPLFEQLKTHSFDEFYQEEAIIREATENPPYIKVAAIYFTAKNRETLNINANMLIESAKKMSETHFKSVQIIGPKPCLIEKRINKYTWMALIKSNDLNQLHNVLNSIESIDIGNKIQLKIDIDPQMIM